MYLGLGVRVVIDLFVAAAAAEVMQVGGDALVFL